MRWGRRSTDEGKRSETALPEWHEGAHWVAGNGAVVKAQRAGEAVAQQPTKAA